jgi:hypothetical protein
MDVESEQTPPISPPLTGGASVPPASDQRSGTTGRRWSTHCNRTVPCEHHAVVTFVSGNPGAGKSTLTLELVRRGYRAIDADAAPGLAAWMDKNGAVVGDDSRQPTPELLAECFWGWSGQRLSEVLEEAGPTGFLLGIAVNQWDFIDRFDSLVLLELDEVTQRDRVASRDPLFQRQIQAGLPLLQAQMIERGADRIDATQATTAVADAVIERTAERQTPG